MARTNKVDRQALMQTYIDSMKVIQSHYVQQKEAEKELAQLQELRSERQNTINELQRNFNDLTIAQKKHLNDLIKLQNDEYLKIKDLSKAQKLHNDQLAKQKKLQQDILGLYEKAKRYLMDNDKIIKMTNLNLGLSGAKADMMRASFEQSAGFTARLGGSLEDVQKIMEGYADETGRARVLSAQMTEDIMKIGKGTGLGIEQATKLGAQFEIMGFDAKNTMNYVQGIVDTSERMGVNTTKVLKNLNENFKKLQTMTFIGGSKAMAQMAMNSEKMKVNMATALNLAETTRGLEQVIDMTANLQVMGGEFAKLDPFQVLYMSRNEPEKWTEEISKMTRGIYTFKKMTDGTFEKFISPADKDRLDGVAKSLGISVEEIHEIGKRRLELDKMNKDMMAMGLSPREKELIQGAAVFNKDSGKFEVLLGTKMKDISSLTKEQANSFAKQSKSLEERAKEAQTFEEVYKATINELKSALLPILGALNKFLVWIRPTVIKITELFTTGPGAWAKVALLFAGVAIGMKGAAVLMNLAGAKLGNVFSKWGGKAAVDNNTNVGGLAAKNRGIGTGAARAGTGKMLAGAGAGIGAAALGIGAGIGAAAAGISLLADAMAKLKPEQVKGLQKVVRSISILVGIGVAAAASVMIFSSAAGASAAPLTAFGGALLAVGAGVALIGVGIGAATAGIGYMFTGIGKIVSGAGELAKGVGSLVSSFSGLKINKETISSLTAIASTSSDFMKIGNAFAQISQVLSGSKDDWVAIQNAVNSISNANLTSGGMIADLARLMKTPLKVEFVDKNVAVVSNITMLLDGKKFFEQTYDAPAAIQNEIDIKGGKAGRK